MECSNMLDTLKQELKKRKEENQEVKTAIEQEKRRIEETRKNSKKSILRKKIVVLDSISTAREEKRDARTLEKYKENKLATVNRERTERRNQMIKANQGKIAVAVSILVAVIGIASIIGYQAYIRNRGDKYNRAVDLIINDDYSTATKELKGVDYEDSNALSSYASLQSSIDSYSGKADAFLKEIKKIHGIKNDKIKQHCHTAIKQTEEIKAIQDEIEAIDIATITSAEEDTISKIREKVSDADSRYCILLNIENLDNAQAIIENTKEGTPAGDVIIAIQNIGQVTLEAKDRITTARGLYNVLSSDDKKLVKNYKVLTSAEERYQALVKKSEEVDYSIIDAHNAFIAAYNKTNPNNRITREMVTSCDTAAGGETTIRINHIIFDMGYSDGSAMYNVGTTLPKSSENLDIFLKEAEPFLNVVVKDAQKVKPCLDNIKQNWEKESSKGEDYIHVNCDLLSGLWMQGPSRMDTVEEYKEVTYELVLY